jgi:hypothetical protein
MSAYSFRVLFRKVFSQRDPCEKYAVERKARKEVIVEDATIIFSWHCREAGGSALRYSARQRIHLSAASFDRFSEKE